MGGILYLTHRIPWPPDRGDKIRSHHILRKLAVLAPVHLGCFADDARDLSFESEMVEYLASSHVERRGGSQVIAGLKALLTGRSVSETSFASDRMQSYVNDVLASNDIDCIFVFSSQMAQYVPAAYSGRFIMDFVDVDSAKFESYGAKGNGPMAWVNKREGNLLSSFEHHIAERADMSLFVSDAEAALFHERSGLKQSKISSLSNGIDLVFYDPSKSFEMINLTGKGPLILFTGQMDYRPNVEAVESFTREVMPNILSRHEDARFVIVGRNPVDAVKKLDGVNSTIVVGEVDDVQMWLHAADVVVAPLRIARGVQNKVLEAMAMAKPVVASAAAAEGIDALHGVHFVVADSPIEEARHVNELLDDTKLASALGKAARGRMVERYSWDSQLAALDALVSIQNQEAA